ncbi:MAG: hypothetical protein GY926_23065, partial [bacterium]|nr:hypothetical protein [bacterium]
DVISTSSISTTMGWYSFDIGSVDLNDGQTYYIRIGSDSGDGKIYAGSNAAGGFGSGDLIDKDGSPQTSKDLTFRVEKSNAAPVLGNNNLTVNEGQTIVLTAGDLGASDVDNLDPGLVFTASNVTNGQFELSGVPTTTFTQADVTAGNVTFVHDGGEFAPSYDVEVSDGSLTDGPYAATITFTAVNDAPTASATATNPTHTEGDAAVDLFNTVVVSTVESGQTIEQIVLTVTNVTDGSDETITIDGSVVFLTNGDNDTTGSGYDYMVDVIGNTATITIDTSGASVVDAQNLIDGFSYQNSSQNPTQASRAISITGLTDSGSGTDTSNPNITTTVNVVALNDAPTIALPVGLLAYTENDPASIIDAGTFISDVDGGDFDGGTLTITFSSGGTTSDQLSILAGGNVTSSGTDVLV